MQSEPIQATAVSSVAGLGGLERLRAAAARHDPAAAKEAAVEFEALMLGTVLKSARQAGMSGGLLDGGEAGQYLDMLDQQVALEIARRGELGFGNLLLGRLGAEGDAATIPTARTADLGPAAEPGTAGASDETRAEFVRDLLPDAKRTAARLGIDPALLVAQAAAWTLEQAGGAAERRRVEFRAYPSRTASFADYAHLIETLDRYSGAAADAGRPEAYVEAVASGGYATDPSYAEKWLDVYHSEALRSALGAQGDGASL